MATKEVVDLQLEQVILQALHTMPNGLITIIKQNNCVVQVHIEEDSNDSSQTDENSRDLHLTLVPKVSNG